MRANLQRLSATIAAAHRAPLLDRARLAMGAVDQAAALLAEMVEKIERLEAAARRRCESESGNR